MSTASNPREQLMLADALTAKTHTLCDFSVNPVTGLVEPLEVTAPIFDQVTPVTAALLMWWFGGESIDSRSGFNFHPGQKQAILNTIVAHEVLGVSSLHELYSRVTPDALTIGHRLQEVSAAKHAHPKYCLKMATGTGKTWVLQALLIWQLLNKTAAVEAGIDDPRFTRNFLIVAPGLIVYERLLDAFLGKENQGQRDFASSDIARNAELFIPEIYRERVFGFVRGNVCAKTEIGLKATGNGLIAISNWHLLSDAPTEEFEMDIGDSAREPKDIVEGLLPLMPGKATGNSLDVLDRRYARGNVLEYLAGLSDLLVFNDEAHHIHEFKRDGDVTEVEWQKSLSLIAPPKGRRFVQVDFSATPFNDVGSGKNKKKVYFPHIVVDFDLNDAMRAGLVKSLVIDKRINKALETAQQKSAISVDGDTSPETELAELNFKADRDEDGNVTLSDGQKIMLSAGWQKLRKLEHDFTEIDPDRHPKMLVVCEDTSVAPKVAEFLHEQFGLQYAGGENDDVMVIDSGRKAELGEKEWLPVKERLFNIDRHASPKVIVSVLMLREGFDVNNICVIVPLRSSQAQILLEQTIGRGLRLMWRQSDDDKYEEMRAETRDRLKEGKEPENLIDVLTIIEHPAFQSFYDDLMNEGLAFNTEEEDGSGTGTGDLINVDQREDAAEYDFAIPFILREAEQWLEHELPLVYTLPAFTGMDREALEALLEKGEVFRSQDLQSKTIFGDYRVNGAVMQVGSYNDWLMRMTRRITQALSQPLNKSSKIAAQAEKPYLQVNTAEVAGWIEDYVREQLFAEPFEPLEGDNWHLLLLQPVVEHITKVLALALSESQMPDTEQDIEVKHRRLSEVPRLLMRENYSMEVNKCIYKRLGWSARHGGLEHAFIEWASRDASVEAFCKISETRHTFTRLRYVKDDGMPAMYCPDFLVRSANAIYIVETKAQRDVNSPNVLRKLKAAHTWCERINALPDHLRSQRTWHYVLLPENKFYAARESGANLAGLLDMIKTRILPTPVSQGSLL